MADLTQDQVHAYIRQALAKDSHVIKPDRRLWGNREATWSSTLRNYRLESEGWEDAGWYRNKVGERMRVSETVIVHLVHRMATDPRKTEDQAISDRDRVIDRLLTDSELRATSIRVYLDGVDVEESDSGDHLETDIAIRLEYDRALTEVVS